MKATLQAGLKHTAKLEVTRDRTIDFMGEKARVYATPMLVRDIDRSRELLFVAASALMVAIAGNVYVQRLRAVEQA